MKPETFVKDVLVERLHPEYVVVGNDFRFGKNRQGDVTMLQEYGTRYGFEVLAFEKLREQGTIISSSYIREQWMSSVNIWDAHIVFPGLSSMENSLELQLDSQQPT